MTEGVSFGEDAGRSRRHEVEAEVESLLADAVAEAVERQADDHRELKGVLEELLGRLRHLDDDLERRNIEIRDLLEAVVTKNISAETGRLREEVTAELERIESRVDRLLGSGLIDVGAALGDELQTLRARAALSREERRTDLQVANRIGAMEDRLDRLIRSVSARGAVTNDEVLAELRAVNEELGAALRGSTDRIAEDLRRSTDGLAVDLRSSNDELAAALREANRDLADALGRTVVGDGERTRESLETLEREVGGRFDQIPSETRLVAVYERLEGVLERLREERDALEQRLTDGLARGRDDVTARLDLTMERHRDEVGEELSRIFDQLSRAQAESESRESARRAELLDHLETLFDDGLAELRRAADRLGEEVMGLGPVLSDEIASIGGRLDRVADRVRATTEAVHGAETRLVDHTSTGIREFAHRIAARTGEQTEEAADRITDEAAEQADAIVARIDDRTEGRIRELDERTRADLDRVLEAVRALDEQVGSIEERSARLLEASTEGDPDEERRQLLADIARALEGRVCPDCGFVARNARGLSIHQRTHAEG